MRQVFYQAIVHGIVEKTEAGYAKVQTDLVLLRRADVLPYEWLADNTRLEAAGRRRSCLGTQPCSASDDGADRRPRDGAPAGHQLEMSDSGGSQTTFAKTPGPAPHSTRAREDLRGEEGAGDS